MEIKKKFSKKELIERGRSLVEAATTGNLKLVTQLLEDGASPDAAEYTKSVFYDFKNYHSPLHGACLSGHMEIVRCLINYGADVNCPDRFNLTPLHVVADSGNFRALKVLIEADADCNVVTIPLGEGYSSIIPYEGDTTPLHMASAKNHIDCVVELIQNGADYNALDSHGRTSLYIAAHLGFSECVIAHIRNNMKGNMLSLPCTNQGNTPLHHAILNGMNQCVTELLAVGADPSHCNDQGFSPFHCAISRLPKNHEESHELIKQMVLMGYNVDFDNEGYLGECSLQCISFAYRNMEHPPPTISFLVSYGADPDKRTFDRSLLECEFTKSKWNPNTVATIMQALTYLPPVDVFKDLNYLGHFGEYCYLEDIKERSKWYNSVVDDLKTLQHLCRLNIRKSLRTMGLLQISKLPIPKKLQEYILLQ